MYIIPGWSWKCSQIEEKTGVKNLHILSETPISNLDFTSKQAIEKFVSGIAFTYLKHNKMCILDHTTLLHKKIIDASCKNWLPEYLTAVPEKDCNNKEPTNVVNEAVGTHYVDWFVYRNFDAIEKFLSECKDTSKMDEEDKKKHIAHLVSHTNIIDILKEDIDLKKIGANYVASCPFCVSKKPAFTVSETKQFYHCFDCEKHGNVIDFIMTFFDTTLSDALEVLEYWQQVDKQGKN